MELVVVLLAMGAVLVIVIGFFVHLLFALGVMRDGDRIRTAGGDTRFVGPGAWAASVLLGGLLAVALYWLIHHSSLRAPETKPSAGQ